MVRPAPIPSDPARSYSAPCRLPSPPRQCHHNPQQTPPPPRPDDGPVRRETALPWKTAPGWVQHRSPPQHMVWEIGCKPLFHSLKSRFANFRTGPKRPYAALHAVRGALSTLATTQCKVALVTAHLGQYVSWQPHRDQLDARP